jgi:hypothetical protein
LTVTTGNKTWSHFAFFCLIAVCDFVSKQQGWKLSHSLQYSHASPKRIRLDVVGRHTTASWIDSQLDVVGRHTTASEDGKEANPQIHSQSRDLMLDASIPTSRWTFPLSDATIPLSPFFGLLGPHWSEGAVAIASLSGSFQWGWMSPSLVNQVSPLIMGPVADTTTLEIYRSSSFDIIIFHLAKKSSYWNLMRF